MALEGRCFFSSNKAATAISIAAIALLIGSLASFGCLWASAIVGIVILAAVAVILKYEYVAYATIFLVTLDIYRFPLKPFNISLFRIMLLVLIVRFIFGILIGEFKIIKSGYHFLTLLYFMSVIVSFLLSENLSLAQDYLFNAIAGISIIFILPNILVQKEQLYKAMLCLVASNIAVLFYSGYTYYQYFSKGVVTSDYPLRESIPFALASAGHIGSATSSMGFPRLALPFGAPQLSLFLALNLIILIGFGTQYAKKTKQRLLAISTIMLLTALLIGTVSRSGWLAFLGGLVSLFIVSKRFRGKILVWSVLGFFLAISIVYTLIPKEVILNRISSTAISGIQRHIETRLEALNIFVTDLKTVSLGIGLGNYPLYTGERHSHSPYTTVFVERGVSGGLIFLLLYIFPFLLLLLHLKNRVCYYSEWFVCRATLLSMIVAIIVGFAFYEFDNLMVVWFSLGFASSAIAIDRRDKTKQEVYRE